MLLSVNLTLAFISNASKNHSLMKRGQAQMPRKQHFYFLALQSLTVKRAKEQQKKTIINSNL